MGGRFYHKRSLKRRFEREAADLRRHAEGLERKIAEVHTRAVVDRRDGPTCDDKEALRDLKLEHMAIANGWLKKPGGKLGLTDDKLAGIAERSMHIALRPDVPPQHQAAATRNVIAMVNQVMEQEKRDQEAGEKLSGDELAGKTTEELLAIANGEAPLPAVDPGGGGPGTPPPERRAG